MADPHIEGRTWPQEEGASSRLLGQEVGQASALGLARRGGGVDACIDAHRGGGQLVGSTAAGGRGPLEGLV